MAMKAVASLATGFTLLSGGQNLWDQYCAEGVPHKRPYEPQPQIYWCTCTFASFSLENKPLWYTPQYLTLITLSQMM